MEILLATLLIIMLAISVLSRGLLHTRHWINPLTAFNLPQALLLASFIIGIAREAFVFQLKPVHVALLALGYASYSIGTHTSFLDVVLYYAGGDIATFGYFIDFPYPSNPPGRFTLGGLYEFANDFTALFGSPVLGEIDDVDMVADIGTNSNTSIHLAAYYSDFRAAGIIGFSAILGFASMWAMANCARCSVVRLQYCALLLFVCVMAIRGTPTEGKYFWTLLIVLPIVHRVARYRFRRSPAYVSVPP